MDWLPLLLMAGLALTLATMAIRHDGNERRLKALAIGGRPVPGSRIIAAKSWLNVRTGLLNHAGLAPGAGLWLEGASSVHTRGMLFPIDVVFLDAQGRVLGVKSGVAPGVKRLTGPNGTKRILELAAGAAAEHFQLAAGDVLNLTAAYLES